MGMSMTAFLPNLYLALLADKLRERSNLIKVNVLITIYHAVPSLNIDHEAQQQLSKMENRQGLCRWREEFSRVISESCYL
jgi:hypothetical protein